jgi:hypothetical protein
VRNRNLVWPGTLRDGLLVLGSLSLPGGLSAQASPIDPVLALEVLAEAAEMARPELTRLWGVPLDCPLLLADRRTRQVAAGVSDDEGVLQRDGALWVGQLPEGRGVANTAFDWAGRRWTMVAWPLPARRADRAQLLAHELFHCIQPRLGQEASSPVNAHLDTREGRLWLRLEWRALEMALVQAGEARVEALRDALLFRAHRRSAFPTAGPEERALERFEGLAEYTGFQGSGWPAGALAVRAAGALAQWDARSSFPRGFAYASGPAYGILLDESGHPWREAALRGVDLGELAAEAHGLEAQPVTPDELRRRGLRYEMHRVEREEDERVARAQAILEDQTRRFVEGPIVRLPPGSQFNFSFDPNMVQTFRGGMVLPTARISDEWGVLEVTANGVWLPQEQGLFTGIILPAPSGIDRPEEGEGWRLRLAPGWHLAPGERDGDWEVRRDGSPGPGGGT